MDYSQYTVQAQFSPSDAARVQRMKKFLANDHSHSSKERIRQKLSGLYKKRRKMRAGYDTPLHGAGSMSNQQIDQQIVAGVRTKFGNEIDASPARQAQIAKYYDDWQTELGNIKNQQHAQAQAQMDAATQMQAAVSQNEQAGNNQLLQQMQADAASRGATVDPSLFIKANQASANRADDTNIQKNQMAANQRTNDAYYGAQGFINRGQKQSALDKERSYTSKLRSDASDYATTLRQQLEQQSFDRGLAKATLGAKIEDQRADNAREQQRADAYSYGQYNDSSGGSGGSGGSSKPRFTRDDIQTNRAKYQKLRDAAVVAKNNGKLKGGKGGNALRYIQMLVLDGYPEYLARAVVIDALHGGVDKRTRRTIKREMGITPRLSRTAR